MANAVVSCSSSGDNAILAAPGNGRFYRVQGYVLDAASAVNGVWKSGATAQTGALPLADPLVVPVAPFGWFDCGNNEALNLNLSGAVAVGGHVTYQMMGGALTLQPISQSSFLEFAGISLVCTTTITITAESEKTLDTVALVTDGTVV